MKIFFFVLVLSLSCSKKIALKENEDLSNVNNYEKFSPIQFADYLANLQCEYHHISFKIIKGNSDDFKKAEELSKEISNIFSSVQNKYIYTENVDSTSFLLFQKELRILYDACMKNVK
tara:strand:+ start:67 stop:420 length:354 start_codon:yes stop_codon:yes gene_type:complete